MSFLELGIGDKLARNGRDLRELLWTKGEILDQHHLFGRILDQHHLFGRICGQKHWLLHWEVFSHGEDSSIPGGGTSVLANNWGQLWDSGTQGGDLETSKFCHKNIYDQDADNKRPMILDSDWSENQDNYQYLEKYGLFGNLIFLWNV